MIFDTNPCNLKEMVQFVHEVHPVFVVILSTFAHMLCGHLANEVRKCLKFENVALFLLLLRGKPRTWWHGGGDTANLKHSTTQHRKPRTFYCKHKKTTPHLRLRNRLQ